MELYDEVIEKLKAMVGPGKLFANQSDLAERSGVGTSLISKHFKKQRGDSFRPFFKMLECADVKIVFPYEEEDATIDCSKFVEKIKSLETQLEYAQELIASQKESLSLYREKHEKTENQSLKNKESGGGKPTGSVHVPESGKAVRHSVDSPSGS